MEKVSVVIPVYNSERSVGTVVEQLKNTLDGKVRYEIVLVDDHSPDGSLAVCKSLADKYSSVKCIALNRNFGQPNAKMAGLHYTDGDYIVCMDDDGQNPPEHIFALIDEIRKGYDVVFSYCEEKKQSLFKNLCSSIHEWTVTWLLDKPRDLKLSSYFIFTRAIANELKKFSGPFPYPIATILQLTTNIGRAYVPHLPRAVGSSNYNLSKLFSSWSRLFVGFSIAPLRMASLLGILLSFLGMTFGLVLVVQKLILRDVIDPGWTSIMVGMFVLAGVQLLFLGIIGEYVGRILLLVSTKPQFFVREVYGKNTAPAREQGNAMRRDGASQHDE